MPTQVRRLYKICRNPHRGNIRISSERKPRLFLQLRGKAPSHFDLQIYNTWDPNWRGFVGVTFVMIYEEFGDLLSHDLKSLMLESLYNTTVGDTYRVGGVDGDNLYAAYSNPWLMRCVVAGWTGRRWNDTNMTTTAETDAQAAIDLFNIGNALSEFNSPTYVSTVLTALAMWAKYMPQDSVMKQNGARMLQHIWATLGDMYHPLLKNLAGPMDRAYGFDMNKYVSNIGLNIWALVGKDKAPGYKTVRPPSPVFFDKFQQY